MAIHKVTNTTNADWLQWIVDGSSKNKKTGLRNQYLVTNYPSTGNWACNCPSNMMPKDGLPKQDCKHILEVRLSLAQIGVTSLRTNDRVKVQSAERTGRVFKS